MAKLSPQRVNLITLGVDDLARSRKFYQALGWRPAEDLPEVTFFRLRGCMLGLFARHALARDQGRTGMSGNLPTIHSGRSTRKDIWNILRLDAARAGRLYMDPLIVKTTHVVFCTSLFALSPAVADLVQIRALEDFIERGLLLPPDRQHGYLVSGELYPTTALGVRVSYLQLDHEALERNRRNDSIGFSAEWFLRRHVAARVTFQRSRVDRPSDPRFGDSDTISVRLLGRL